MQFITSPSTSPRALSHIARNPVSIGPAELRLATTLCGVGGHFVESDLESRDLCRRCATEALAQPWSVLLSKLATNHTVDPVLIARVVDALNDAILQEQARRNA